MKAVLRRSGLKPIKYTLQIHYPGRIDVPVAKYESSSPFAAISQGDYLHPFPTPEETSAWTELGPSSTWKLPRYTTVSTSQWTEN
jgi:hypothetical protein